MQIPTNEITDLVKKDFALDHKNETVISEQELLDLLTEEVALMMETRMDFLLGLMYRLDVDETKIQRALSLNHNEQPSIALARLILDRQKQRIWSKKTFKSEKIDDWEDF